MDMDLFRHAEGATSVASGTAIFEQGEDGAHMYVLVQGSVDLMVNGQTVDTLGPASIFGEMALIDSQPRSATAITRTDSVILAIDEERFMHLVQLAPKFALEVMRALTERLRRMDQRL